MLLSFIWLKPFNLQPRALGLAAAELYLVRPMSSARFLLLFCAVISVAHARDRFDAEFGHRVPRDWLPPHFPKSAILQSVTRSFDTGLASGTFLLRPEDASVFRSRSYQPAHLKPERGSRLYEMQKAGASVYAIRVDRASWIVILEDRPDKMLTIEGKKWIDGYFWVDRRLYSPE